MNTLQSFNLNKLKCEVAIQQTLNEWQPQNKTYDFICRRCQCTNLKRLEVIKRLQKYKCKKCHDIFWDIPKLECNCQVPGTNAKCKNCPQYKQFLDIVKEKMNKIDELNIDDLEQLRS